MERQYQVSPSTARLRVSRKTGANSSRICRSPTPWVGPDTNTPLVDVLAEALPVPAAGAGVVDPKYGKADLESRLYPQHRDDEHSEPAETLEPS